MNTKKSKTVIKIDGYFWTGHGFSAEYPDADLFQNWPSSQVIIRATENAVYHRLGNVLSVYRNYGETDQTRYQFINSIRNENDLVVEGCPDGYVRTLKEVRP